MKFGCFIFAAKTSEYLEGIKNVKVFRFKDD